MSRGGALVSNAGNTYFPNLVVRFCAPLQSYIFAFPMQKQKLKTFMVLGMQNADMVYCVAVSEGDSCCQLLVCKTQGCQDAAIIVLLFLVLSLIHI